MKLFRGVLRDKIWNDLFGTGNTSRTIQAVLSIAVGAFAVGAILGILQLIQDDISVIWQASNPASIIIGSVPEAAQEMLDALENTPGATKIEGEQQKRISWRRGDDEPWQLGTLVARDYKNEPYDNLTYFQLILNEGVWPTSRAMSAEQNYGIELGESVLIRFIDTRNETQQQVYPINGVVYSPNAIPAPAGGTPLFYTTQRQFGRMFDLDQQYTGILSGVPVYSQLAAERVAGQMVAEMNKQGYEAVPQTMDNTFTIDPTRPPLQDSIDGMGTVLSIMAVVSLILGLFLVYNTITAIVSQQITQIGVLKAIGASRQQILILFFAIVFIYGLLALAIAVPLGVIAAHFLRVMVSDFLGIPSGGFGISMLAILAQIFVCLLAPLLIAIIPIFKGAGVTVREAINTYGLGGGGGWLDRQLGRLGFLSQTISMAVSNTFRNKLRMLMVELTLIGAGTMFMAVLSTQSSLYFTYSDLFFKIYPSDVILQFEVPQRIEKATTVALSHPSVTDIEIWNSTSARIRPQAQPEEEIDDPLVIVTGMPIPSNAYNPEMRAGRFLQPDDEFAVVIHQTLAEDMGLDVGDWVTLEILQQADTNWQVVGIMYEPDKSNSLVAPRQAVERAIRDFNRGSLARITTDQHDEESVTRYAETIEAHFNLQGMTTTPTSFNTVYQMSHMILSAVQILVYILLAMAFIIAAVGAISLSGTLSINVLERRREIGVLRAVGAPNKSIALLFVTEGLILGWISWILALLFSYPAGLLLTEAVSSSMQEITIIFAYNSWAIWIWLVVITLITIAASWTPAQKATQVSVRESLAYD